MEVGKINGNIYLKQLSTSKSLFIISTQVFLSLSFSKLDAAKVLAKLLANMYVCVV